MKFTTSQQIVDYMNNEHQLALIDYIVVYGKVELRTIVQDSVKLLEIDEKTLTINYTSSNDSYLYTSVINWVDALENEQVTVEHLADAKAKLLAMAEYSAAKQGFSHKQIKTVSYPSGLVSYSLYALFVVLALNWYDPTILRTIFGNEFFQRVFSYLPAAVAISYLFIERWSFRIFVGLAIPHSAEVFIFTIPGTRKYRVSWSQSIQWNIMNFFVGFFLVLRFNRLAQEC
ncbi:uncharacterized protein RJT20DRAFT_41040 [Scheffersomyces xylosifermentans]|uniref:uncharacterized protein n=1 Tax=Scheffersomyces xylosifermentans TaxID=1304137 RepID=UPI00315CE123